MIVQVSEVLQRRLDCSSLEIRKIDYNPLAVLKVTNTRPYPLIDEVEVPEGSAKHGVLETKRYALGCTFDYSSFSVFTFFATTLASWLTAPPG